MHPTEQTIMNNPRGADGELPRSEPGNDRIWTNPYDALPAAPPLPPSHPLRPFPRTEPPVPAQPYIERKSVPEISHLSALYNPPPPPLEQLYNPPPSHSADAQMHSAVGQGITPGNLTATKGAAYFTAPVQPNKCQKKVYFPANTGINYIGLLIGPKGMYQKKLEEQTGCKILIRGKYLDRANHRGTQKDRQHSQNDTDEDQHVLVIGFRRLIK